MHFLCVSREFVISWSSGQEIFYFLFSMVVYISRVIDTRPSSVHVASCWGRSGWQTSWKLLKIVPSNAWNAPRLLKLRIGNIFAIYRLRYIDAWIKKKKEKKMSLRVAKMIDLLKKKKKKNRKRFDRFVYNKSRVVIFRSDWIMYECNKVSRWRKNLLYSNKCSFFDL